MEKITIIIKLYNLNSSKIWLQIVTTNIKLLKYDDYKTDNSENLSKFLIVNQMSPCGNKIVGTLSKC